MLTGSARDGYLALSSFVRQAANQREAEALFDERVPRNSGDRPASVLVVDKLDQPLGIDVFSALGIAGGLATLTAKF